MAYTGAQDRIIAELKTLELGIAGIDRDEVDEGFLNIHLDYHSGAQRGIECALSVSPSGTVAHYDINLPTHYPTVAKLLESLKPTPRDELRSAVQDFKQAVGRLAQIWEHEVFSGDEITDYPDTLPSFDELALQVSAMEVSP